MKRNLFRFLRAMWIFASTFPYTKDPPWTEFESGSLCAYLRTPAGRAFYDRRVAASLQLDQESTTEQALAKGQYMAGIATGYRMAVADILADADSNNFAAKNETPPKEGSTASPDQIPGTESYDSARRRRERMAL